MLNPAFPPFLPGEQSVFPGEPRAPPGTPRPTATAAAPDARLRSDAEAPRRATSRADGEETELTRDGPSLGVWELGYICI